MVTREYDTLIPDHSGTDGENRYSTTLKKTGLIFSSVKKKEYVFNFEDSRQHFV